MEWIQTNTIYFLWEIIIYEPLWLLVDFMNMYLPSEKGRRAAFLLGVGGELVGQRFFF